MINSIIEVFFRYEYYVRVANFEIQEIINYVELTSNGHFYIFIK